jgi:pimeloyl-ACP methyl ester carboxylesterase
MTRVPSRAALCAEVLLLMACGSGQRIEQAQGTAWTDPSPHRVSMVTVAPDVRLEVLDWGGAGPPLVFLSGLQDVAHGFDDFAPRFTDHFHVVALTRRGYGASSQPATGYVLDTRVADLRTVLDSMHLSKVFLVGHSIAGDELTAFAGKYPDRVAGLVYLDAAYDHSGIAPMLGRTPPPALPMLGPDSVSPAAVNAYLKRTWGMMVPEAQLRAVGKYGPTGHLLADVTPATIDSAVLAGCGRPDYARVHAPALAIYAVIDSMPGMFPSAATFDSATTAQARRFTSALQQLGAEERARYRREMPAGQVLEIHGANHYVFYANEAQVEGAMRGFLEAES